MATKSQKAQIHILKADLDLSRDQYEGLLAPYGVNSSADPAFTQPKANQLIATMRRMARQGQRPDGKDRRSEVKSRNSGHGWGKQKYEYLRPRPAHLADPKQLRKIEAIWRDLARNPGDSALANFLHRQTGIRNIVWLQKKHATAVLCAEEAMKNFNPKKSTVSNG